MLTLIRTELFLFGTFQSSHDWQEIKCEMFSFTTKF